ncbi:MAG: PAS domain-containing protein [Bacteroidales bacterium]|jgi:two-component system CheB/CheR fusion protein|nr:PAS domain-containing protein [Bacteroidales bacterium]
MKTGNLKSKVHSKEKTSDPDARQFPIVGIGASAGGLEALEQFLSYVPENSGMAFVVIQHLDPTQKGMLPELLQRITKMKVFQVQDRLVVKPDCVYVIPPNKTMSILKGRLHLFEPKEARGLRLPIDFFLRSLADDQKERSIGLILSGMGSDGSIGLRAIKERNGIVMVQEPANAKFDSMPRNAIDSVVVDMVAPANVLPSRLLEFLKHIPLVKSDLDIEIKDKSALEKIIILLRTYTGNDFSLYKKNTVYRRIERRMSVHKIERISSYVNFLQENPKEVDILFKELMIGVTNFFRDPAVWEKLKETVIPNIISNLQPGSILRAWVPGCSTGEEAYSLAIVFKEALEKINSHGGFSLQIFATDVDPDAIEIARKGIFPANIAADVSADRLNRFFLTTDEGYFINTEIRETVVFAQHNIIMHPPFTKIDILSCRNLLIYLEPELQKKLLGLFYYSMNPNGIMLLGSSETLGLQSHLFTPMDIKLKIFKRAVTALSPELFDFPAAFSRAKPVTIEKQIPAKVTVNIQTLADQLLLQHFTPVGVLVNENGDIIYISGHTGKYLEPAVGKANMNIFAMLREGLRNEFPVAFRKAIMKKEVVYLRNLKVGTNGEAQILDIRIQWIEKPEPLNGMLMIIFTDVPENADIKLPSKKEKKTLHSIRQSELEKELKYTREKLQDTLEEMQTSQEELKSTNEELQSTNEELQSTNEELTSSKEEMQSLNEELQTLNAELQSKVDDFTRVNNDMKNLLNSTDIATLFLDKELHIRRFTIQSTKIFKLIKSDIGRPFTDLVSDLLYPELSADALEVLKTLVFIQKPIPTKDGRWFSIRIMPYRTIDDRIDGLVITFINISDLKKVELKLHETEQMNSLLLNSSSDIIIKLSTDGKILEFNPEAETFFGKKREEVQDQNFIQTIIPEKLRKKIENVLKKQIKELRDGNFKIHVKVANGDMSIVKCSITILLNNLKMAAGMILSFKKC